MADPCKFCEDASLRPDMVEVGPVPGGVLYLHRDQTHSGRLLLASQRHVKKVTDLSFQEYRELMDSVYRAAQAVTDLLHPDKINYLIFGDTGAHLHIHIVPKYRDGKDWGKVFLIDEPTPVLLPDAEYLSLRAGLRRRLGLESNQEGFSWAIF